MAFGELQQTVLMQNDYICRLETRIDKLCNTKQGDVIEAGDLTPLLDKEGKPIVTKIEGYQK